MTDDPRYRVPSYPRYAVTEAGLVFGPHGHQHAPYQDAHGFFRVNAYREGERRRVGVHELVCETFHGPRPTPGHLARHKNGIVVDNRASNLHWEAIRLHLSDDDVRAIRQRRAAGESGRALAVEYKVNERTISRIYQRKQRADVQDANRVDVIRALPWRPEPLRDHFPINLSWRLFGVGVSERDGTVDEVYCPCGEIVAVPESGTSATEPLGVFAAAARAHIAEAHPGARNAP